MTDDDYRRLFTFYSRFTYECTMVCYDFSQLTYEQSRLCTIPYDSRRLGYTGPDNYSKSLTF